MTPPVLLLWLRLLEVVVLAAAVWWIVWTQPPSAYRDKRLAFASALFAINLCAITVCVLWLKVDLW